MDKLKFDNVYERGRSIYTLNFSKGSSYGEKIMRIQDKEFRLWDPLRSKLAAFIAKGTDQIGIRENNIVLYLGASSGTTVSHVSDIVRDGFVFALEVSPTMMRKLYYVCKDRNNLSPILADASNPELYKNKITKVDVLYQDIAQRNQLDIFFKNSDAFLKQGGFCILCVKARSIDVVKKPKEIYKEVIKRLSEKFEIINYKELDPFQKDHCIFLCKKKN